MADTLATIGFKAETRELDQADAKLRKLGVTGEQTERKITDSNKGMSESFRASNAAVAALTAGLGTLAATVSVAQVIQYSDGWKSFNNVLRQVTTSEADFIKTQQAVLSLAKQTNSNLQSTAELYGELTRATADLGLSSERVLNVTGTINKLFLAGGKSAAEASGSIRQLAQALGAGALRGDEFNSVAEGAPRILDALAKQLNMTRGELREFAATGGITAEIMVKALEGYATEADKMVGVTQRTFAQTNEIIQANITQWVGSSKSLQAVTDSVGSSLLTVSENLEPLAKALGVGASILGGAWVLSAGRAAAANIALGAATAGVTTATYALTAATRALMGPLGLVVTAVGAAAIAFDKYADDADSARAATEKLNQEWERSSNAARAQQYVAAQQRIIDIERQLIDEEKKLQEVMKQTGTGMFGNTTATANQARVISELSKEKAALQAKIEGMNKAFDNSIPPITGQTMAVKAATKSAKELRAEISRIADLEDEMENAFGGDDMLIEIYQGRAKAAEELMDEWSEGVDTFEEDNKRAISISEKAAERIEEAFAGAWMNAFDGFESVIDGMKNAFKRMLAEMAHMALTRPIMVSMGLGGMLPGGASASTLGGASSAMSGLGLLGGIGSGLIGAGSMIGGAFGGGLMGGGALVGAGQFGTLFSGAGSLFGSGNIAAGLGMSMPIILAGLAGAAGLNKLTGGGLFGTSFKTTGQSLGLSLGGGDVTGSITTEESKKRSLFRGTKRRTTTTGYDASAIDDAFDAISESLLAAATTFGIEGADAVIKGFAASVNIDIKDKTEAEIQDAIAAWVGSTTEGLVNAVFGNSLDGLQKEGEGVIDTVNRLAANMQAVTNISDVLGINFGLTGKAAMAAATNIVEFAGGLDQLSALSTQYYQSFYSEAERQANLAAQLSESFAALNIAMPDTREGFRALVDGLDLTSEAGQKMFAELMKLVPGMDQYLSALEAQRQAAEDAAKALNAQGLDLQLRLYDALGQSSEALALRRQMELDATDETLLALLLQIYAAEDAAAAQRELAEAQEAAAKLAQQRQSLEIQLLEATGQSAQALAMQRQIELEAMDESLRGLQLNVWSAIDAAAAQKELVEAQAEAAAKAEELLVQRQSMEIELLNATGRTAEATAMQRAIELAAMDESLRALQQQIWAANDATEAQRALAEAQKAAAESAQNAFSKLQYSASAEKEILQSALDARLSAIDSERQAIENQRDSAIDGFQKSSQAIDDYVGKLQEINDTITGFIAESSGAVNPFKRLGEIFNEFKGGITPDNSELGSVLGSIRSAGSAGFASATDQARAMAIAMNQAQGIGALASSRASSARSQYDVISESAAKASAYYAEELSRLDAAAELAKSQHAEQVSAIDAQLAEAQKQLNALLGIDDRILTMSDALAEFYLAIGNANNLQGSPSAQAVSSAVISSAVEQVSATKSVEMAILDSASSNVEALYGSTEKQIEAVSDVVVAIEQLGEQIIEINKPEDRVWVPPTMPEMVKEGAPVTREMLELLDKLLQAAKANADHSSKSANYLQEMTIGGIDVRVEA